MQLQDISTSGVRQGCVLAPTLFCRAIDWIMGRVASTVGFSLDNVHFTNLVMQMTLPSLLTPWMTFIPP